MRRLLLILSLLTAGTALASDVNIHTDIQYVDWGFHRRGVPKIWADSDSTLYVLLMRDTGNDIALYYSNNGGNSWTQVAISIMGYADVFYYGLGVYQDTAYVMGNDQSSAPVTVKSYYESSFLNADTLGTINNSSCGLAARGDSIGVFQVIRIGINYYSALKMTDDLSSSATWTYNDSIAHLNTDIDKWLLAPLLGGMLAYNIAGNDVYFTNSNAVYVSQSNIFSNYPVSQNQYFYVAPKKADGTADTVAWAVQCADSNRVYVVMGYIDSSSSYVWTPFDTTWVTAPGPTSLNEVCYSYPVLQWDDNGALRLYSKAWPDTNVIDSAQIVYYTSTDYGATWSSPVVLRGQHVGAGSDKIVNMQAPFRTPAINGSQILIGVAWSDSSINLQDLWWTPDTIDVVDMGGAEVSRNARRRRILAGGNR